MKLFRKILLHAALAIGAALFAIPFLWMTATALKPIEQTMSMPPTWLPWAYYLRAPGGELQPVRLAELVTKESYLLKPQSPDVPARISSVMPKTGSFTPIPASREHPHYAVVNSQGELLAVDASQVVRRIQPRWENFSGAIKAMHEFPAYLYNTLALCFLTVFGTVLSSALTAYAFSCLKWRGRDFLFALCIATMMVPFPVVMVPLYGLFKGLGLLGTSAPLWIGSFCASAFNVFLLRQFFKGIPKDLIEAARIDGCGEFMIFFKIVLPMAKPALKVVALFQFIGTWNDFLGPLIYLTDQKDFTLALGLQALQSQHGGTEWHYLMAASLMITLPVIVIFFFMQKTFIEGIAMTGMKG